MFQVKEFLLTSIEKVVTLLSELIDFFKLSFRFKDRLFIDIEESSPISVELSAEGHGSTIVSDPPIAPLLDLKSKFWYLMLLCTQLNRNGIALHSSLFCAAIANLSLPSLCLMWDDGSSKYFGQLWVLKRKDGSRWTPMKTQMIWRFRRKSSWLPKTRRLNHISH